MQDLLLSLFVNSFYYFPEKIYFLSELDLNKTIGKLQIVVLQNEEKMKQIKLEKDTTVLDEEIAKLDVWHWNESILHSEQMNTKADDLKKYVSIFSLAGADIKTYLKENK